MVHPLGRDICPYSNYRRTVSAFNPDIPQMWHGMCKFVGILTIDGAPQIGLSLGGKLPIMLLSIGKCGLRFIRMDVVVGKEV
jgi:hypothetical protein